MTEVPIIQKPFIDLQSKSVDWFLYDRDSVMKIKALESWKKLISDKRKLCGLWSKLNTSKYVVLHADSETEKNILIDLPLDF